MEASTTEVKQLIKVALISRAAADLEKTIERRHLSPVDIVNRAISLYEFVDEQRAGGAEVLLCQPDGSTFLLELM